MKQDMERSKALLELAKIKTEIDTLLVEKAEIVRNINIPIYEAKTKAEKIVKDANSEAEITISAANKILAEAEVKHKETNALLQSAKGDIEKLNVDRTKLGQEKIDLDALRFAHQNVVKQQRDANSQIEAQNRADTEILQSQLVEIKQREDSVARREIGAQEAEKSLKEQNTSLNERKSNLDALEAKLGLLEKALADEKSKVLDEKNNIIVLKRKVEEVKVSNQAILEETNMCKEELAIKKNGLNRQMEVFDNSKAENEETIKSLKEQQRLVELRIKQNDEKITTIKQLRKE